MHINFQSRYKHKHGSIAKKKNVSWWSEWEGVDSYHYQNDIKKIIWKKSTGKDIFEKKFSEFNSISAVFCHIESQWDFFTETDYKNTRNYWKRESIKILQKHAQHEQIQFENITSISHEDLYQTLLKRKCKYKSIFILSNNSPYEGYPLLEKLSHVNEIFWILPYHTFELEPHSQILFSWKIFSKNKKEKYIQALKKQENYQKKLLQKIKIPLIITNISIPIEKTLHYFFKYHYE